MTLFIRNGTVVNDDGMFKADVLVAGGKILAVGPNIIPPEYVLRSPGYRVVDASGKYVMPGGIDTHVHFEMPFMGTRSQDDFYTGTRAAIAGGTTMIIDFVIPQHKQSLIEAYDQWRGRADPKVCCDYGLSVCVTEWNEQVSHEMGILTRDKGVNSFKFFLAYKNMFMVTDDQFFQGMKRCSAIGALARVHAENGSVIAEKQKELLSLNVIGPEGHHQSRPEILEEEATNRACTLAHQANCPLYVVHVMTKGAAQVIERLRTRGAILFGEPIAAGLGVDGSKVFDENFDRAAGYIMSPPLSQDPTTAGALMDMLAVGMLDCTGTDNCTFTCQQKRLGINDFTRIPNGVNGVEDRMSIVFDRGVVTGKMTPMRFVAVTSAAAARIFNCYPRKGRIAPDSDADIVIWDPLARRTISARSHHHAHDFNIFEGMTVTGVAHITISKGRVVWENNDLKVAGGTGEFIPLRPYSPHVYSAITMRRDKVLPQAVHRQLPA